MFMFFLIYMNMLYVFLFVDSLFFRYVYTFLYLLALG